MRVLAILAAALLCPALLFGQDRGGVSEELLGAVVKITSRAPGGPERTGTGFIVRVDGDLVYIATASHVIEGDPKPQVAFYHDKRRPVAADVGALEGGDPKGLAYLIVRDWAVAAKVKALSWSADRQSLSRGEDVLVIGFGQGQGEWGVIRGSVASIAGSDIRIDGRIEAGNSGGPILKDGVVTGMVTSLNQGFGVGKSGIIVVTTLAGWDVPVSTAAPRTAAPAARPAPDAPREAVAAATRPPSETAVRPAVATTTPTTTPATASTTAPTSPAAKTAPQTTAPVPTGVATAPSPAKTTPQTTAAVPPRVATVTTAPAAPTAPGRVNMTMPNGDRYEGDVLGNARNGQGLYVFANGNRYEGGFVANRFSGKGLLTFADGASYEGEFRDDLKVGRGVFRYPNGDRYEGEFVNDEFSGKGVLILMNGDRYEGEFRANAKNGRGVHQFANGARYDGEFVGGLQNGTGTHYYPNGDKYAGQFANGVRNGRGVYTFRNGETRAMEFVNGVEKPK